MSIEKVRRFYVWLRKILQRTNTKKTSLCFVIIGTGGWTAAIVFITDSVTKFDPKQTVTNLEYQQFDEKEYPCLAIAFWNKQLEIFFWEPPEGVEVLVSSSGK